MKKRQTKSDKIYNNSFEYMTKALRLTNKIQVIFDAATACCDVVNIHEAIAQPDSQDKFLAAIQALHYSNDTEDYIFRVSANETKVFNKKLLESTDNISMITVILDILRHSSKLKTSMESKALNDNKSDDTKLPGPNLSISMQNSVDNHYKMMLDVIQRDQKHAITSIHEMREAIEQYDTDQEYNNFKTKMLKLSFQHTLNNINIENIYQAMEDCGLKGMFDELSFNVTMGLNGLSDSIHAYSRWNRPKQLTQNNNIKGYIENIDTYFNIIMSVQRNIEDTFGHMIIHGVSHELCKKEIVEKLALCQQYIEFSESIENLLKPLYILQTNDKTKKYLEGAELKTKNTLNHLWASKVTASHDLLSNCTLLDHNERDHYREKGKEALSKSNKYDTSQSEAYKQWYDKMENFFKTDPLSSFSDKKHHASRSRLSYPNEWLPIKKRKIPQEDDTALKSAAVYTVNNRDHLFATTGQESSSHPLNLDGSTPPLKQRIVYREGGMSSQESITSSVKPNNQEDDISDEQNYHSCS